MTVSAFGVDHGDISKGMLGALRVPGQIKTGLQAVKLNTQVAGNLAGKAIGNSTAYKAAKLNTAVAGNLAGKSIAKHPVAAGTIGGAGLVGAGAGYSQHKNSVIKPPKFGA